MEHPNIPFSIPAIRSFIPERIKPWIILAFVFVIQLSGGVYMAAVSQMVGGTALMQEDIMMAGYAGLAGMSLTFTIMLRLKFATPPKTTFFICGSVIILANLITMHTHSVPLLVGVCFIAGIFRMWMMFECMSTIQLWITPIRDMSVFFCVIYLIVNGMMQVTGLTAIYVSWFASWQYMHWLVIGLVCVLLLCVSIIYRNYRTMPKLPLYGIDWLGMILWGCAVLCVIFICVYGEHYDWFSSPHIRAASIGAMVAVFINIRRASHIRHPFIDLKTFSYPVVGITFGLYVVVNILLSPQNAFEHALMDILDYDSLHVISLNWVSLLGTVTGAAFTYLTFARRKWTYHTMTAIAFACFTVYLAYFYFMIDYNLPKGALAIPVFIRSFGYVIFGICMITALVGRVPFPFWFFQSITIQAWINAACGGAMGSAIIGRVLRIVMTRNSMLLGSELDHVNEKIAHLPIGQLYGMVQQQSLMESMKEIYGWLLMVALCCMCYFMLQKSSLRPVGVIHPKFSKLRKALKHQLRMDR